MAKCISDVKERINDRILRYNAYIDAWKKVERVYTKQGKPFKVFSRNFNNCEIREKDYWNGEKELRVHGSFSQDGSIYPKSYFEDSINITQPLKTWEGKEPSADRIIREAYRDVFQLNVDEVMDEVDRKIELYTRYIEDAKKDLEIVDSVLKPYIHSVKQAHNEAREKIRHSFPDLHTSTLYFVLDEIVDHIGLTKEEALLK